MKLRLSWGGIQWGLIEKNKKKSNVRKLSLSHTHCAFVQIWCKCENLSAPAQTELLILFLTIVSFINIAIVFLLEFKISPTLTFLSSLAFRCNVTPVPFIHWNEIHPLARTLSQLEIGMLASGRKTARKVPLYGRNIAPSISPMAVGRLQNAHSSTSVVWMAILRHGIFSSSRANQF